MVRHAPSIGLGLGLSLRGYGSSVSFGLLDLYPATAAYSAYDLGNKRGSVTESEGTVVNPVQRWRRSSDDALQMFTAAEVAGGTALTWAKKPGDFTNSGFETFTNNGTGDGFTAINSALTGFAMSFTVSGSIGDVVTVDFDVNLVSGSPSLSLRNGGAVSGSTQSNLISITSSGSYSSTLTATGAFDKFAFSEGDFPSEFTVSNVRVSTNDAYLLTEYDQSGNDYDLTQTTAAKQPLVVSGGALTVDSLGNVAPLWDGVNDGLKTAANYTDTVTEFGVFIVSENTTNTGQKTMVRIRANGAAGTVDGATWEQGLSNAASRYGTNTFFEGGGNGVSTVSSGAGTQDTNTHINSLLYEQSQILAYDDGSLETTMTTVQSGSLPIGNVTFSNPIWLGYNFDSSNRAFGGSIAAVILYNTDQSANRAAIEAKLSTIVTTAIS